MRRETYWRRGNASSPTRKVPRGTREPWRLQSPKRSWRGRKTRGDRNGPRRQTSQNRESPGFNYGECQSTLLGASLFTLLLLLAIAIVTLVGKWKVYTEDDSDTNYEVL